MTQSKDLSAFKAGLKAAQKEKNGNRKKRNFLSKMKLGGTLGLGTALLNLAGPILSGKVPAHRIGYHVAWNTMGVDLDNGSFKPQRTAGFWLPIGLGAGLSYAASKTGINRYIPFVNI